MPTRPSLFDLFTPWQLGALRLQHRIVLPAITLKLTVPPGVPGEAMIDFYARRATPGGLVVCEPAVISGTDHRAGCLGLYNAEQVNHWRNVTQAVHDKGALAVAQLGLLGDGTRRTDAVLAGLDADRLEQYLLDYRSAAENAGDAGFDAVELQACDGALPLRLLHGACPECAHPYLGGVDARLRFLDQALGSLFAVWGPARVGLCLAPWQPTPSADTEADDLDAHARLLRDLDQAGLAWLHVVEPEGRPGPRLSGLLRRHFTGEMVVGGGLETAAAREELRSGRAQGVSFAQGFVTRSDLVAQLRGSFDTDD